MSPDTAHVSQLSPRLLKELLFLFQSVYFYLEHLDTRLQVWKSELAPLLVVLPKQRERLLVLEQELEASTILLEEFQQSGPLVATELQTQMQAVHLYYADLDTLEQRLMGYLQQLEGLEQEYLNLAENYRQTQFEVNQLKQQLAEREMQVMALSQKQQALAERLAEQARVSEEQIENLNEIIEKTAQETWILQESHHEAGVALARIAQIKQEAEHHIQQLSQRVIALENENAELQKGLMMSPSGSAPPLLSEQEKLNQVRYQTVLELLHLLSMQPEQVKLTALLKQTLAISDLQAEALHARIEAGLSHLNGSLKSECTSLGGSAGMVEVPAGIYPIGDDLHASERPAHTLKTEGFRIGMFLVTNAEFAQFMATGGYQEEIYWLPEGWRLIQEKSISAPAFWNTPGHSSGEDYPDFPVIGVSWYEAMAYARWAGNRLPTEVEWEMACRGVDGRIWPWGNEWKAGWANTAESGRLNLAPVGWYPKSRSQYGCYDMVGQCYEWTSSLYLPYPYHREQAEDPERSEPRSLRGCAWSARGPYFTRASYRFFQPPKHRHSDIGFRCVLGGNNFDHGDVV